MEVQRFFLGLGSLAYFQLKLIHVPQVFLIKNRPANAGDVRDMRSISGQEDPLEEGMATHSSILVWRVPMNRGAWWAIVHRVAKRQTHLKRFSMHSTHALNPTSWKKD